jgi:hypothetical protein
VALLEGLQPGHSLAAQAERRRDLGPVDLESCASLCFFRTIISSARPLRILQCPRIAACHSTRHIAST